MQQTGQTFEGFALLSGMSSEIQTILISKRATERAVAQLRSQGWFDESQSRLANKWRMKELGGAAMSVEEYAFQSAILLAAISVENFQNAICKAFQVRWDPFDSPPAGVRYAERPRIFRSLSNILKHNSGFIENGSSRFAKYLVEIQAFPDQMPVHLLSVPNPKFRFDLERELCRCLVFFIDFISVHAAIPNRFSDRDEGKVIDDLLEFLVPEVTGL